MPDQLANSMNAEDISAPITNRKVLRCVIAGEVLAPASVFLLGPGFDHANSLGLDWTFVLGVCWVFCGLWIYGSILAWRSWADAKRYMFVQLVLSPLFVFLVWGGYRTYLAGQGSSPEQIAIRKDVNDLIQSHPNLGSLELGREIGDEGRLTGGPSRARSGYYDFEASYQSKHVEIVVRWEETDSAPLQIKIVEVVSTPTNTVLWKAGQ
jgi:hypothetical protein